MSSSFTFAADRDDAYDIVCKRLPLQSDKSGCAELIRPHSYFDDQAIVTCANLSFKSNKLECLSTIAEKKYEYYEAGLCSREGYDTDKINCLKISGKVRKGKSIFDGEESKKADCLPREVVLNQLKLSLKDLKKDELESVKKRLEDLVNKFKNPNCR